MTLPLTASDESYIPPFLRWAGGKRWLVSDYADCFPKTYKHYYEPFLGSAAVFFHLSPKRAYLSDACEELIHTYIALQGDWQQVANELDKHASQHSKEYYYKIRSKLPTNLAERAARFIYLNRTCWNGLYRVNLKGEFNVPIGSKGTVKLETDNFEAVAKKLSSAVIQHKDFEHMIDHAQAEDFVFLDPPYTVKHNHNGFIGYNESLFSWDDQERLREAAKRASKRGVKLLITNADHESIHDLYKGLGCIVRVERKSTIAALKARRGLTTEVLIRIGY